MDFETFKKANNLIQEINRIKIMEQQIGVKLEQAETFGIINAGAMKINSEIIIESVFPYLRRDLSEENYAAIKKECDNFIKNSQEIITNLRKEKEEEFKGL